MVFGLVAGCTKEVELQTANIKTPTILCGTCAKNIEKAVYAVEGVKSVDVDLDAKAVEVKYVAVQTNIETLERAITGAGYDADDQKRDPEAYEKLDACCKIDG